MRLLDQEAETAQPGRTKTLKEVHALIKKENQIFLIFKKILSGVESYVRKGFLIYEEMRKYFPIYEEPVSHI